MITLRFTLLSAVLPVAKMAAPNVGGCFTEDLLEINQNVSYGVVPVRGKDVTYSDSQLRDTPPLYEGVPNPTSSNVDTATLQLERFHNEKRKVMRWILSCFSALIIVNIVSIIALVVAFVLIASLKSERESLGLETSTAETGTLESRFNLLEFEITLFMETSRKMLMHLSESTSGRVNSLEGDVAAASNLATILPGLLNNTNEKITSLQNQLTLKIDDLSVNVTNETDQAIRTTEGFVNSSAIQLATDIRALYVFESCDIIRGLRFPFPSGTYRIGPSQDNYSLMNCRTSTALTCNGISGQWQRVAYLDTSQTNFECPGC